MSSGDGDPGQMRTAALHLLEEQWLDDGYTMPNRATYPWQWLWDSCFHAIAWAELGDERALTELGQIFAFQTPGGFVPHMNYHPDPDAAVPIWGRAGASTITQPPMFGHAIAELVRRGMQPSDEVIESAIRGLNFLFTERRRTNGGLIELCHPWESGCDDSARWDAALPGEWERERWRSVKHHLITTVESDDEGGAIANREFAVGSVGFCSLVAFNALELDRVVGVPQLRTQAEELTEVIADRWDSDLRTWVDDGMLATSSGRARTTDALFALLVDDDDDHVVPVVADLVDTAAYGGACGPAGAHRDEPTYDPLTYWRGPAWPQMSYLLWVALQRRGQTSEARQLASSLRAGATASGFAEFWHPDTGQGAGAIPQSWATLAVVVDSVSP